MDYFTLFCINISLYYVSQFTQFFLTFFRHCYEQHKHTETKQNFIDNKTYLT